MVRARVGVGVRVMVRVIMRLVVIVMLMVMALVTVMAEVVDMVTKGYLLYDGGKGVGDDGDGDEQGDEQDEAGGQDLLEVTEAELLLPELLHFIFIAREAFS